MSTSEATTSVMEEIVPEVDPSAGSLKSRLAARQKELEREHRFMLPVPGYEDLGLYAEYRPLSWEALRRVGKKNEKELDGMGLKGLKREIELEQNNAADTLIQACTGLYEKEEHEDPEYGEYNHLAVGWTPEVARDLFDVQLPALATARNAIRTVFAGTTGATSLMLHFKEYDEKMSVFQKDTREDIRGN